jgi:UDP-3-O-[3-hydroxymyristoyl] N-acetylglucosamine deacetylase/3-hydroxyacyl-[acyl-carrier-protein] dehydratase
MDKQHTLSQPVSFSGIGLHTGSQVTLTILPAPENHGVQFKRTDLEGQPLIPADVDLVIDTNRGTALAKGNAAVYTVEHVLAALAGMQIDNALIEINGPETPILDGSAWPYVEAILSAGIQEQNARREYFVIPSRIIHEDAERKSEIIALPDDRYRLSVMIDFESKVLVTQGASFDSEKSQFTNDIAKARTFVFLHEIEHLIEHNLIKGGDLSNAIVFVEHKLSPEKLEQLATFFNKPDVKVNGSNTLNNVELYFPNEPARHKLLDLIGDLSLVGMPIRGNIIAHRPGHKANVALAKKIKQLIKDEKAGKSMPYIDLTQNLFDIHKIMDFLPHRYPFLLVDRIVEMSDEHVVGIKNVTMNEPFFTGHFPGNPVMPGVMQIEAMAQVGGILAMNSVDDYKQYTPYFIKIESVKFKQKVLPGDTLVFVLRLLTPIRRGICHMAGKAYVDGKVVMEAEMMAQLIKNSTT